VSDLLAMHGWVGGTPAGDYRDLYAYQQDAARTIGGTTSPDDTLTLAALGLAGEVGEAVELVKKYLYHGRPLDKAKFAKELGDVLWYLAAAATGAGLDLGIIATVNMEKLHLRYPNGFSHAASAARVDLPVGKQGET